MQNSLDEIAANEGNVNENKSSHEQMLLEIFVSTHCFVCEYAREIYTIIQQRYPKVSVRLISVDEPDAVVPEAVFATPTYLLNGKVWSLGNPSQKQLERSFT